MSSKKSRRKKTGETATANSNGTRFGRMKLPAGKQKQPRLHLTSEAVSKRQVLRTLLQKVQQRRVDDVGMGRNNAVRAAFNDHQLAALDGLMCALSGGGQRDNPVGVAMDYERRAGNLCQVGPEVRAPRRDAGDACNCGRASGDSQPWRSGRTNERMSSVINFGSSAAAKCPPLGNKVH